jgi:cytochrome c oxidase subunit 2
MTRRTNWLLVIGGGILVGVVILGIVVGLFLYRDRLSRSRSAIAPAGDVYGSNGEMIYFTGFDDREERIPFTEGPRWLYMHGGGCAACHGADGRGGMPVMMLGEVPPDIRYTHLIAEEHSEGHGEEHPPYTDALIKRAIVEGLDPAGNPLGPSMPRWQMDEGDLEDVLNFLKTLD